MTFGCLIIVFSSALQMTPEKPTHMQFGGCFTCKVFSVSSGCSIGWLSTTQGLNSLDSLAFCNIKLVRARLQLAEMLVLCIRTSVSRLAWALWPNWYWRKLSRLTKLARIDHNGDHTCHLNRSLKDGMATLSFPVLHSCASKRNPLFDPGRNLYLPFQPITNLPVPARTK